jgi:uncharacterized protein YjdB
MKRGEVVMQKKRGKLLVWLAVCLIMTTLWGSLTTYAATSAVGSGTDYTWTGSSKGVITKASHTATLLANGKVLITGGDFYDGGMPTNTTYIYDQSINLFTAAAPMLDARKNHAAVLLSNGNVFVVGGTYTTTGDNYAEIYNTNANTWSSVAQSPLQIHDGCTATLLQDGKVLVVGTPSGAEVYDPDKNTWVSTGKMVNSMRNYHTATLLPNGKVLVAGGVTLCSRAVGSYLNTAEIYDPDTNAWAATNTMSTSRFSHTATLLSSGKVLVAGGMNGAALKVAEVYDPDKNIWTTIASMNDARFSHTATLLPSGKILVAGGAIGSATNQGAIISSEMYDPNANAWTKIGDMSERRMSHTATLFPNGKVLLVGGCLGTLQYHLCRSGFSAYADMLTSPSGPVAGVTLDKTTMTLIAGGETGTLTATVFPNYATNQNVTWSSSDTSIATVSSAGEVTPIDVGIATITVTTQDGNKTATCEVTVEDASTVGGTGAPMYIVVANSTFSVYLKGEFSGTDKWSIPGDTHIYTGKVTTVSKDGYTKLTGNFTQPGARYGSIGPKNVKVNFFVIPGPTKSDTATVTFGN